MDKIFDIGAELWHFLPPPFKWTAVVLMLAMIMGRIAHQYFFPTQTLNLLTIGERRRRERIKFIDECLVSSHNDEEIITVLKEERSSLIFQEITRIKTKRSERKQLRLLHEKSPSNVPWPFIKTAYNSLNERDGNLVKGVSRVDAVFGILMTLIGGPMTLVGIGFLFYLVVGRERISNETMAFGFGVAWAYFIAGLLLLRSAFPVLQAKQLQKYLPIEESETACESSMHKESAEQAVQALPHQNQEALPMTASSQEIHESIHVASSDNGNGKAFAIPTKSRRGEDNDKHRSK